MAPRPYWKGYLKLALVSCPVKLYSAVSSAEKISFNQLHKDTHNRVQMRYHDPELGEVSRADLVKGYQFEKDKYVIVEKDELDQIQIESTKTIDIEGFVDAAEVDQIYQDAPYFLGPDGKIAEEPFAVIREALTRSDKVGIARIVLAGRERLLTLQPRGEGFLLTTLRTNAEVRSIDNYVDPIDATIDDQLLEMAEMIIDKKTMTFDPDRFEDRYETALMKLIKAKVSGHAPVIETGHEDDGKVINLMDALKASIDGERRPAAASKPKGGAGASRSRAKPATKSKTTPANENADAPAAKPRSRTAKSAAATTAEPAPAAAKKPARKPSAKTAASGTSAGAKKTAASRKRAAS